MQKTINSALLFIMISMNATSCTKEIPTNVEMSMLAGRYISEEHDSETLELRNNMLFVHEFKDSDGRMVKDSGSFSSPLKVNDVWFLGMKGFYSKYSFDQGELEEHDHSFTFEIFKKNGGIMLCHIEDSDSSNCFIKE